MNHEISLPLFPLGVVLFPESALPLHIFEERYKILVRRSIERDAEFGINLVREQSVVPVGCTARVRSVLQEYDDGRMDIVVEGRRRFRLMSIIGEGQPYMVGNVLFHPEQDEPADPDLRLETIRLHNQVMEAVYHDGRYNVPESSELKQVSFRLAQKVGLELDMRQTILEMDSEAERLRFLRTYLNEFLPRLRNAATIELIAQRDGYL